jgi:hypothetical protein
MGFNKHPNCWQMIAEKFLNSLDGIFRRTDSQCKRRYLVVSRRLKRKEEKLKKLAQKDLVKDGALDKPVFKLRKAASDKN